MPDKKSWTADDIPDLSGKTIIVTGGNSGIGYEAALEFARKRADVVLACRSLGRRAPRPRRSASRIRSEGRSHGTRSLEPRVSAGFADAFHQQHRRLDVLCNNAGVMALPYRHTADGFEMQFGTNHLGHFALTGLLLDLLLATAGARVVTRQQRRASHGQDPLRRSPMGTRLSKMARVRPKQAGQPAVRV